MKHTLSCQLSRTELSSACCTCETEPQVPSELTPEERNSLVALMRDKHETSREIHEYLDAQTASVRRHFYRMYTRAKRSLRRPL